MTGSQLPLRKKRQTHDTVLNLYHLLKVKYITTRSSNKGYVLHKTLFIVIRLKVLIYYYNIYNTSIAVGSNSGFATFYLTFLTFKINKFFIFNRKKTEKTLFYVHDCEKY